MKEEYTADEITDSLEEIYSYMYENEIDHYEELSEEEREGHIFESVHALGVYLGHVAYKAPCKGCGSRWPDEYRSIALSRYGHGDLCSHCGTREALEGDFISKEA